MNRASPIVIENQRNFLRPPTYAEIKAVLVKLDVHAIHFERFHGIPEGTIYQVKHGSKDLPRQFWHLIFTEAHLTKNITSRPMVIPKSAKSEKIIPKRGKSYGKGILALK